MCKETGYAGICNNNSTKEQLCDNGFINCYRMTETEDKIDGCWEKLHQDAALNSTVITPETTDSKTFETFKVDKTYKSKKKRGENIPVGAILGILS